LAKYEILSTLPSGGGKRSLAVQRGFAAFRKLVVVREILEEVRNDEESFQALVREAKIAALFSHPNVADLYDVDAEGERLLVASEFVAGASLGEIVKACRKANLRLPLEVTLRVLRDACLGLHYAHGFLDPAGRHAGLVHRELSDETLIVSFEGITKVTDFCTPQVMRAGEAPLPNPYAAPEFGWGDQLDARTDIYSLGVLLNRCITELKQPAQGQPGPGKVPAALESVAQKATAKTREGRYASAHEMARAMEGAAGTGWDQSQIATFMQRLFAERRARMAEVVKAVEVKETTAVMRLSEIFTGSEAEGDAAAAVAEATQPRAKSPYQPEPPESALATSPRLIRPRRVSVFGRLGRLLALSFMLALGIAVGLFSMDPVRAIALARGQAGIASLGLVQRLRPVRITAAAPSDPAANPVLAPGEDAGTAEARAGSPDGGQTVATSEEDDETVTAAAAEQSSKAHPTRERTHKKKRHH